MTSYSFLGVGKEAARDSWEKGEKGQPFRGCGGRKIGFRALQHFKESKLTLVDGLIHNSLVLRPR
jgi:hypothetical protein